MNKHSDTLSTPLPTGATLIPLIIIFAWLTGYGIYSDAEQGWSGALIGGVYGLSIALGACILAAISTVSGARWWAPISGIVASVGRSMMPGIIVLILVFAFGLTTLYPWTDHAAVETNHLLHHKQPWLNTPFFLGRAGVVMLLFIVFGNALFRPRRLPTVRAAVFFILAFAAGISVAWWDWLMSLEPEWFSTMYGVYGFAGALRAGIAAVILLGLFIERYGPQEFHMRERQRQDLASLLFGFSMFWAYIWFCQYMLIWYANLPEEAGYFVLRQSPSWNMLFWLNPIVGFILPCFLVISLKFKRDRLTLFYAAAVAVVGQWIDIYMMVGPSQGEATVPIYAITATLAVVLAMWLIGKQHFVKAIARD